MAEKQDAASYERSREVGRHLVDRSGESAAASADSLHGKYHGLRRTRDDSEVEGWYFVIREGDEAGEAALLAYADACEGYAPELAKDLRQHVRDERLVRGLYEAGWER